MQHDQPDLNNAPNLPTDRRAMLAGIGGLAAGALLVRKVNAGPLSPPPGPVESTHKTLTEVEPRTPVNASTVPGDGDSVFRIKQPGSYYLTDSVIGVPGLHGIKITASGVTLDLRGFTLQGVPGSLSGILIDSTAERVSIHDGFIASWDSSGVRHAGFGKSIAVARVVVTYCKTNGIFLPDSCAVIDCQVSGTTNTGGFGIHVNSHSVVDRCVVQGVAGSGIRVFNGSTVSGSAARNCGGFGILTNANSTVRDCSASENGEDGILIGEGCSAVRCVSGANGGNGINGFSGLIEGCTATFNSGNGILGCFSNLKDNYTEGNSMNGILSDGSCLIRDNQCADNAMAGIKAMGSDNRIEGNTCRAGSRGIQVDGFGNIIIRNTCSGSAINWAIAAVNSYGPILNIAGLPSPAVSGSAATGTLGTTDPHANFTY